MRALLALSLVLIYSTLGVIRTVTNWLRDHGALRLTVGAAFVIAAGAMLWLIFREPRNRNLRVVIALVVTLLVYALLILPMEMPEERIHFIQYGVVALLADGSAPKHWSARRKFIAAALFVLIAGWIDELIQGLLPSRYYDLRDVAFNAMAGLVALSALAALRRIAPRPD